MNRIIEKKRAGPGHSTAGYFFSFKASFISLVAKLALFHFLEVKVGWGVKK